MNTLKYGSRGEEVKTLQRLLGIAADGIYGKQTEITVREFQRKNGLIADGIVGPKTWLLILPAGEPTGTVANQPAGTVANQTGTVAGNKTDKVQTARRIDYLFVHCTAGNNKVTPQQLLNFFYREKKWSRPGYHYVVAWDGTITQLWPEEKLSNGVKNMNAHSINIAWIGGVTKEHPEGIDNRTEAQKASLRHLLQQLRKKYPKAKIMGHRDTSPDLNGNGVIDTWERIKSCPCFDAMVEYKDI